MTPLAAALHLAAEGYPVFPCLMNKRPSCKGGFHSAKADRYAIEELWESSPGDLIGVPAGLLFDVLDIDAKHEAARNWWNAHRDALPRTRAHRTRSGGLHLLFQPDPDVACPVSLRPASMSAVVAAISFGGPPTVFRFYLMRRWRIDRFLTC